MADEPSKQQGKQQQGKADQRQAQEGDPEAPPGTAEHLGSDRPYEGQQNDEAQDR